MIILNPYYSISELNAFTFFFFFKKCTILTPDTRKTTSNLLTTQKGKLMCNNGSPLEGGMYINLW